MPRGGRAYTYYPNGSLKSDEHEQISNIIYDNFLKQPIQRHIMEKHLILEERSLKDGKMRTAEERIIESN